MKKRKNNKGVPVLITTNESRRGVFFGYIKDIKEATKDPLWLEGLQMAIYWPTEVKGVLGLMVDGPSKGCRISKPNEEKQMLNGITLVSTVSKKAEEAWLKAPWSNS